MDRVFLDANVLFSAAYREGAGLLKLWKLGDAELITSEYAADEARRNLDSADARARLEQLVTMIRIVPEGSAELFAHVARVAKEDEPILGAAISAQATHLLTGDLRDFGKLFGKRVRGVLVQTPGDYLRQRETGKV
jgi:predicted nucleic acid-binding protein